MNAEERALRTAAVHEAAHWVCCDRCGIPVKRVEIGVKRSWWGDPRPTGYVQDIGDVLADREEYVLMCLAGPEAQARVEHQMYGGSLSRARRAAYDANDDPREGSDVADARRHCREGGLSYRRAQVDVIDLVDDLWDRVERASRVLLDRRVLRGQREVEAALRGVVLR